MSAGLGRWVQGAACGARPDLPWIADADQVSRGERDQMAAVCFRCPVLTSCTTTADQFTVTAAFWAGKHREDPHRVDGGDWVTSLPTTAQGTQPADPLAVRPAGQPAARWVQSAFFLPGVVRAAS